MSVAEILQNVAAGRVVIPGITYIDPLSLLCPWSFPAHTIIGATRFVKRLIHINRMTAMRQGGNNGCCI